MQTLRHLDGLVAMLGDWPGNRPDEKPTGRTGRHEHDAQHDQQRIAFLVSELARIEWRRWQVNTPDNPILQNGRIGRENPLAGVPADRGNRMLVIAVTTGTQAATDLPGQGCTPLHQRAKAWRTFDTQPPPGLGQISRVRQCGFVRVASSVDQPVPHDRIAVIKRTPIRKGGR